MQRTDLNTSERWSDRPLCCRYLLAHFSVQRVPALASDVDHWSVTWAQGTLSDGSREVLGAWQHTTEGFLDWSAVFDDLALRGVERVRFAVDTDASAARITFPHVGVLQTSSSAPGHVERSSNGCEASEVPLRVRLQIVRSEVAARALQRRMSLAALRYGPFESGSDAAAFVEAWLVSAERSERHRRHTAQRLSGRAAAHLGA